MTENSEIQKMMNKIHKLNRRKTTKERQKISDEQAKANAKKQKKKRISLGQMLNGLRMGLSLSALIRKINNQRPERQLSEREKERNRQRVRERQLERDGRSRNRERTR